MLSVQNTIAFAVYAKIYWLPLPNTALAVLRYCLLCSNTQDTLIEPLFAELYMFVLSCDLCVLVFAFYSSILISVFLCHNLSEPRSYSLCFYRFNLKHRSYQYCPTAFIAVGRCHQHWHLLLSITNHDYLRYRYHIFCFIV